MAYFLCGWPGYTTRLEAYWSDTGQIFLTYVKKIMSEKIKSPTEIMLALLQEPLLLPEFTDELFHMKI